MKNNAHKIGGRIIHFVGSFLHVVIGIVLFGQLLTVGSYGVMATYRKRSSGPARFRTLTSLF